MKDLVARTGESFALDGEKSDIVNRIQERRSDIAKMMGGSKYTDSILVDNPYPSLDITLGSMEPSFIVWEDEKETTTSFQDMGQSIIRGYSSVAENTSLGRKAPSDNENHDSTLSRLSLKEHERVSTGGFLFLSTMCANF